MNLMCVCLMLMRPSWPAGTVTLGVCPLQSHNSNCLLYPDLIAWTTVHLPSSPRTWYQTTKTVLLSSILWNANKRDICCRSAALSLLTDLAFPESLTPSSSMLLLLETMNNWLSFRWLLGSGVLFWPYPMFSMNTSHTYVLICIILMY